LPIASTDEQLALQASIREWAKRIAAIDLVRGLEPGGDAHHEVATTLSDGPAAERWTALAELGVLGIGTPTAAGGTPATGEPSVGDRDPAGPALPGRAVRTRPGGTSGGPPQGND